MLPASCRAFLRLICLQDARNTLGFRKGRGAGHSALVSNASEKTAYSHGRRGQAKAQDRLEARVRIIPIVSAKTPKTAAYVDGSGTAVKEKLSNAAAVPAVL